MEEKEIHDELASIRSLMERSSKFISLSGLSGILAGIYALVGAAIFYYGFYGILPAPLNQYSSSAHVDPTFVFVQYSNSFFVEAIILALIILIASIATAIILSSKKAKRNGQPLWSKISRTLLFNMAVPLVVGGALVLIHVLRGHYGLVAPSCLVFYGLALVSASNYTFTDVKYLGLCEIALGLIAACLPGYGLLFWAIGFGVLHIIYGGMMYLKYDK